MNNDAVYKHSPETRRKITDILNRDEIRLLTARSDLTGAWAIISTWVLIASSFALIGWAMAQPLPLAVPMIIAGIALLGGRQLALAIITHEATHKTLFKTQWANNGLTDWLCARPIGLDLAKYRAHHFIHHTRTGTDEDSDISLITGLPTTRASLLRKLLRDMCGITGLKFLTGRLLMDAGILKWTVATNVERLPYQGLPFHLALLVRNASPTIITNLVLFAVLALCGYPELYLAWLVAYLIPYPLFIRIRALAEHACTEHSTDMFKNTRTTRAGWIARTFVAPLNVNYHIEHHAMASVPWFRLKTMHQMLRERQVAPAPPSYWQVMRIVSSA